MKKASIKNLDALKKAGWQIEPADQHKIAMAKQLLTADALLTRIGDAIEAFNRQPAPPEIRNDIKVDQPVVEVKPEIVVHVPTKLRKYVFEIERDGDGKIAKVYASECEN